MSQTSDTQDESARTPGVVTTALQSLRLPLALALLAYLVLDFLISLIRIAKGENVSGFAGGGLSFAERAANEQNTFLGLFTLILLAIVVVLAAARPPLKLARPIVLTTLVLTGVGLLFGFIGILALFFVKSQGSFQSTRDKIETTLLDLPVLALYVLFALFLLTLLSARGLPRTPKPEHTQHQYGQQYPGGPQHAGIPGFPPVEQQPYGYQQQPQGQYDPWQGYPQQGYQQQPYQPEPPYQPAQPEQPPYQPAQPDPYQPAQTEQAPYQPPPAPEPAPWNQPPYRQPDPPAQASDLTKPVDISKHEDFEPSTPAQPAQAPFSPYWPPTDEDRPGTAPLAWPQQPAQSPPTQSPQDDDSRPEANAQRKDGPPDWYPDGRHAEAPEPPPYGGWSGPHL